jgi:thiol:disulfide interchange protein DsbD
MALALVVRLDAQTAPPPATVTPLVESDAVRAGTPARLALRVELAERLHANSNRPRDRTLIPMTLDTTGVPAGVTVREIVWPPSSDLVQQGAAQPLAVFERTFAIGVAVDVDAAVAPGDLTFPVRLRYQACDEKVCYFPQNVTTSWTLRVVPKDGRVTPAHEDVFRTIAFGTGEAPVLKPVEATSVPTARPSASTDPMAALARFDIRGTAAGSLNTADFLRFIDNAEKGVTEQGWFEGRGPLAIVLLVLIGGLALNLTPCVLPMIPINLAIIGAGAQSGSRVRGLLLGATYGGAMALVYGALGLVVILTAGTFGSINASPWFNASIAALFVVLGLAMFDVFTIDFSSVSSRLHLGESGRGTFVLAFTMGAVAALLAGACVAPVVIQVLLLSSNLYAAGTTVALALPFFLGAGMAIPWPIAGAGIAALPRPGAWMVRVKQAFGVFIIGTAVYYGYTAYGLFASRWVDPAEVASSVEEKLKEGWYASLPAGIAAAEKEGKPVLIDFWATWCKNCLLMDRTTLKDERVNAALASYVKIKFQAEDPEQSPAKEAMDHFNAVGLPTYVILKPADN